MNAQQADELLARLRAAGVTAAGITADSRELRAGELFAAWPGFAADGRRHIDDALVRGAAAVLWEAGDGFRPAAPLPVPGFGVEGLRALGGYLAHELYGRPSASLWAVGVTGTNGKTTVSQWLARALGDLGLRCGVIGTLGSGYPDALVDALNTTPDALEVHRLLAGFVADGAAGMAMEVSSIGLDQGRVNAVEFDVAIFTNLSRDHLDYHGTMEAYADAKARLFTSPKLAHAVINLDDAFGLAQARRLAHAGLDVIGYTQDAAALQAPPGVRVLSADALQLAPDGLRFAVHWRGERRNVRIRMVGPFNVSNLLAVIGALFARAVDFDDVLRVAARLTPPLGRMQLVGGVCEPLVVVDYAHTPDALAKVLEAVRGTVTSRGGRLVCVFGCGGDRDPGKRPLMGEVARQLADRVIVTSDNPRSEDPLRIIEAIRAGTGPQADCVVDRAQAIALAIGEADANDVVVVAGKGHEPYQEVLRTRLPFSDVEQARAALLEWNRQRGEHA